MKYSLVYANLEKLRELDDNRKSLLAVTDRGELLDDPLLYEKVFDGDMDENDPDFLENLFEQFNIGDFGGRPVRSMSVGDLVVFGDGSGVLCTSVGWVGVSAEHAVAKRFLPKED